MSAGVHTRTRTKAFVAAVVEDALVAFNGTRGPHPSDEAIWAAIAWRIGWNNFREAMFIAQSEMRTLRSPIISPAAFFQHVLNREFPRRKEVR